ncbi:multiple monosaccharide ABC transporter ATP-binding protein [Evansella tamaricis]|uniref:Sugar ABC transporter ATP-binding protein n=1 Tax=Evansella tamaricis TaxID=2069301 RepID=A0ABS6JP68_9BACI|nr:multiple monosaccharide ABC transporter ATP-binding protein [Evansella tamaricis]MBU9714185.1 sugar ABC transporter ATP-binding protein [Evansella tamaricis]
MSDIILEMRNITKTFPGVKALDNVNFQVEQGEIHALVGENGAGKSTLMKVLSGVYPFGTYEGDILFEGDVCHFKDINESEEKGIVIIHQELALIPELSIAENIFLGNEQSQKGIINWNSTIIEATKLLKKVGLADSPRTLAMDIGVGKQQLVEIAKALSKKVKLLILDEPTAALNEEDSQNLLNLLLEFKKQGMTSIIISHKLNEVSYVADNLTILRDGKSIETLSLKKDNVSEDRIIKGMVGRDLENRFPPREPDIGEVAFEIKNWNVDDPLHAGRKLISNVNFELRKGEIVGIAGLMGAGRTELAMSIFGKSYGKNISGQIIKDGKEIQINNIKDAIDKGLAYVTEDRKTYGLILIDDIKRNISLTSLEKISKRSIIDKHREVKEAEDFRKKMNIRTPSLTQKTGNLSGGNQQKVVLSKWMLSEPDILILDEPTRGIDVGAKYEIYNVINQMAAEGKAVLVISSELPELLGLCDRIYALSEGQITGEVAREEANQETLMKYMTRTGGNGHETS